MDILILLIGFLPLIIGLLESWLMMNHIEVLPDLMVIGIVFFVLWGVVAFFASQKTKSIPKFLLLMNAVPALVLVLLAVQVFVFGGYWPNVIGAWSQHFYLPTLSLSVLITRSWDFPFWAYTFSFVGMVIASATGCGLRNAERL